MKEVPVSLVGGWMPLVFLLALVAFGFAVLKARKGAKGHRPAGPTVVTLAGDDDSDEDDPPPAPGSRVLQIERIYTGTRSFPWKPLLLLAAILGILWLLFVYLRVQDIDLKPRKQADRASAARQVYGPRPVQLPPSEFRNAPSWALRNESGEISDPVFGHPGFRMCPYDSVNGGILAQVLPYGSLKGRKWQDRWSAEAKPLPQLDGTSVDAIRFWSPTQDLAIVQVDYVPAEQACPSTPAKIP